MSRFIEYLDSAVEKARAEQRALESESRRDEADFARIKQNIFTVAKTIHEVFLREKGESFADEYRAKLSEMRTGWEQKYETAQQYGDAEAAAAERIKIDTMLEIEAQFSGKEE